MELALAAGDRRRAVDDLVLAAPLILAGGWRGQIQVRVGAADDDGRRPVASTPRRAADGATVDRHATGTLAAAADAAPAEPGGLAAGRRGSR